MAVGRQKTDEYLRLERKFEMKMDSAFDVSQENQENGLVKLFETMHFEISTDTLTINQQERKFFKMSGRKVIFASDQEIFWFKTNLVGYISKTE